jgi:hypothetical protein
VVKAAQRALATGNVTPALIWVQPAAEAEVRDVFTRTMAVRQLSAAARELADRYFYETLSGSTARAKANRLPVSSRRGTTWDPQSRRPIVRSNPRRSMRLLGC